MKFKKIISKNFIKKILTLLSLVLIILTWKYWYQYYIYNINPSQEELENQKIDEYNFEQLEKVKVILKDLNRNDKKFSSLSEFNKIYKVDIKPIKNCYILSNINNYFIDSNLENSYMFMFSIYSEKYKNTYKKDYYIYPYNYYKNIEESLCWNNWWYCGSDIVYWNLIKTISNPCKEEK